MSTYFESGSSRNIVSCKTEILIMVRLIPLIYVLLVAYLLYDCYQYRRTALVSGPADSRLGRLPLHLAVQVARFLVIPVRRSSTVPGGPTPGF